jgi:3-(3-hydroxy-phenyl)propionate hydroxylase
MGTGQDRATARDGVAVTDRPVYDVVIVGQGPVGATAACLLADEGLTVLALESQLTPYPLPRAARFDGETMRTFQRIGVAEEIARNTYVGGGGQFLSADGEHLGGWAYHPPTNGWENSYYFFQPELEEILNRRVAGHPGIEVRTGATLVGYQQSANAVDVTVRMATGPAETFTARYLVGCDGARSTVRSAMGVAVEDLGYEERWVVVDVNLLEDAELPTITTQYCDPDRPATYVPGRGAHRRWEFMLAEGEDARTLERPDVIHAMLGRYVDPAKVEIVRASLYTFHSLLGRDWRSGRVLLAGDAAHQTPPFLGQGMCSGIRDAQNLSWKLAAVVNGSAPDSLLDTYQAERAPHFRAIMERAIECGRIVGVFDHDVAEVRNKEFLRRMGEGDVPFSSYRVPSLAGGLIGPGSPAPAGGLSRQGYVEDQQGHRRLLDEVVGGGAVLLVAGEEWSASPADAVRLGAAADQAGVALCVIRPSQRQYPDQDLFAWHVVASDDAGLCAWVSAHRFILVRPDRYIQGVAGTTQAAAALLRQWSSVLANPEHIVGEPA